MASEKYERIADYYESYLRKQRDTIRERELVKAVRKVRHRQNQQLLRGKEKESPPSKKIK